MDVLIKVHGAPDHDHPDREHEADTKGCEHVVLPGGRFWQKTFVVLRHAGEVGHGYCAMAIAPRAIEPMAIEPEGDAL
jgi:hypothetical protein